VDKSHANHDRPIHYGELYVNYGLQAITRTPELLRLRMDTWYYADSDHLGHIALGDTGVTAEKGLPTFLVDQLAQVFAMSGPYIRFHPNVRIGHQPTLSSIRASVTPLTALNEKDLLAKLHHWLQQTPDVVTLLLSDFDLCLAVRATDGEVIDCWLPLAGNLSLSAQVESTQKDRQTHASTFAWQGGLDLRVLSLFRRDNEAEIQHARILWERFRDADPEIDIFPEEADEDPIVVLADSPAGTPRDNEELCKRNLPRIQAIIHAWEAATDRRFHWVTHVG
jgi:hypothetical protein